MVKKILLCKAFSKFSVTYMIYFKKNFKKAFSNV